MPAAAAASALRRAGSAWRRASCIASARVARRIVTTASTTAASSDTIVQAMPAIVILMLGSASAPIRRIAETEWKSGRIEADRGAIQEPAGDEEADQTGAAERHQLCVALARSHANPPS